MILTREQMFGKIQVRNFTCVFERLTKGGANMEDYKEEIKKLVDQIDDEWILEQILRCIKNIM